MGPGAQGHLVMAPSCHSGSGSWGQTSPFMCIPCPAPPGRSSRTVSAGTEKDWWRLVGATPWPCFPHSLPPKPHVCMQEARRGECQSCSRGHCKTTQGKTGSHTCLPNPPTPAPGPIPGAHQPQERLSGCMDPHITRMPPILQSRAPGPQADWGVTEVSALASALSEAPSEADSLSLPLSMALCCLTPFSSSQFTGLSAPGPRSSSAPPWLLPQELLHWLLTSR